MTKFFIKLDMLARPCSMYCTLVVPLGMAMLPRKTLRYKETPHVALVPYKPPPLPPSPPFAHNSLGRLLELYLVYIYQTGQRGFKLFGGAQHQHLAFWLPLASKLQWVQ